MHGQGQHKRKVYQLLVLGQHASYCTSTMYQLLVFTMLKYFGTA